MDQNLREQLTEIGTIQKGMVKTLDKHTELLEDYGKTLLRNTITVEEHHKRSTHLENRQNKLEKEVSALKLDLVSREAGKKSLKEYSAMISVVWGAGAAILGAGWGLFKILKQLGF